MRAFGILVGTATLLVALLPSGSARAEENTAELDLEQWEGKVVLLDFWASWCGPCAESFPWMNEMDDKYAGQGLVIVGVNLDAKRTDADRFLAERPARFEQVFDPEGVFAEAYAVDTMPTSILIDRDGKVVARHRGFRPKHRDVYERNLVSVLNGDSDIAARYAGTLSGKAGPGRGVRPWEKGVLALPEMALTLDSLDLEIDDHIYFSKEASSGGRGFGGGGCGCN